MEARVPKPGVPASSQPVLIIDDDSDAQARESLARRLTRWGYSVLVASDALAAISLCEEIAPCLLVLGETRDDEIPTSTLLHELADILYEQPPPVALLLRRRRSGDPRTYVALSPLLVLEDLLDGADERCAA
jgi:DNA-binding response OmpR family regulator